jgi:lipopolysaccharide/colanic/teichoic acid biosynthesis glycosyltransferase
MQYRLLQSQSDVLRVRRAPQHTLSFDHGSATAVPLHRKHRLMKRSEDLVVASLLTFLTLPLMLLVALAIRLESCGPVLFWQRRGGCHGELIWVCKFRSMYADVADEACERQTLRGDPRVTLVGGFIRRHSLDELPQLFNVLGGGMSLVGPRPHAVLTSLRGQPIECLIASYDLRNRVKPGITGWAQVNGWRGTLDTIDKLKRRVEHDVFYTENWSILFDLKILLMTVLCILKDKNAF